MMSTVVNELAGHENDPVIVTAMREAANHNLYALTNSAAMNGVGEDTTVKVTAYYLVGVFRTLAIVLGVLAIPAAVMWSRGKKRLKSTEAYGACTAT